MRVLGRSFYARPTVEVARALLGKVIKHQTHVARIVETEAYLGIDDAAAHAAAGVTPRTRVIFGPPGHAYVYLIYGIHNCLNIVAEPEGTAGCVLIRAVEPIAGIELASNGPGRLTRALGITLRHNGCDVTHGPIVIGEEDAEERKNLPTLHTRGRAKSFAIGVSPRIGITKSADLPLRFFILENRYVSGRG